MIKLLQQLTDSVEHATPLDSWIKTMKSSVRPIMDQPAVKNVLGGEFLGHPVHPLLTDIPIGAWSMSALLDIVGGEELETASSVLVGAGVASALPAAVTGLHDWSKTDDAAARVGLVHAATMDITLLLYAGSLVARLTGRQTAGKILGFTGWGVMSVGGYLGGHLTYALGANVDNDGAGSPSVS